MIAEVCQLFKTLTESFVVRSLSILPGARHVSDCSFHTSQHRQMAPISSHSILPLHLVTRLRQLTLTTFEVALLATSIDHIWHYPEFFYGKPFSHIL